MAEAWLNDVLEEIAESELDPQARSVLVVDDDDLMRDWLVLMIKKKGYAVSSAAKGQPAIDHIVAHKPRVCLVDKNLPDMSGLEIIRRGRLVSPDTEFVVLTGDATLETAIEAVNLGAMGYIPKPFKSIDDVLRKVRAGMDKQRIVRLNRFLAERLRSVEGELLATKLELDAKDGASQSSLREKSGLMKKIVDDIIGPLRVVEDDVGSYAEFAQAAARGEPVQPKARGELGRLKMLEDMVRQLVARIEGLSEHLAEEGTDASGSVPPLPRPEGA